MSRKPKIEVRNITDLQPDPNNINKHTVRGHTIVENSIRKRGVGRGILAAGKADVPVILAGNLTHEKARDAGIEEVVFVHTTGNQLVVNVRDDLDPESADAMALAIEDNESQRLSYAPDLDLVAQLAAADTGVLAELRKQDKVFDSVINGVLQTPVNYEEEWQGMPEFDGNNMARAFRTIIVHFEKKTDLDDFSRLIKQRILENTKFIWYPEKPEIQKGLIFENES